MINHNNSSKRYKILHQKFIPKQENVQYTYDGVLKNI